MVTGALSIVYELSARCCFIASAFVGYCDDMFRPGGRCDVEHAQA